jgi:PII-like signaling protein
MTGSLLRFYLRENERQHGRLVWWWLLTRARKVGIGGGSAFRAMAGFGRHRSVRVGEACLLSAKQAIEVEFLVTDEEADKLLEWADREQIRLFYARIPSHFGALTPAGTELQQ